MDVKSALVREMRGIEGFRVMLVDSQVDASAADAVVERSAWKMQSTRSLTAYAEWVHNTTFCTRQRDLSWLGLWSSLDR